MLTRSGVRVLSARGRQAMILVTIALLIVDASVTGLELIGDRIVDGRSTLLDVWDTLKLVLIAGVSTWVSIRVRSKGVGVFTAIFALIALEDLFFWHGEIGEFAADLLGLDRLPLAGAGAWGQFLALTAIAVIGTAIAVIGGVIAWTVRDDWPGFREVRLRLTIMLAVLFFFATIVDLLTDITQNSGVALLEETGERVTLSFIAGYLAGIGFTLLSNQEALSDR